MTSIPARRRLLLLAATARPCLRTTSPTATTTTAAAATCLRAAALFSNSSKSASTTSTTPTTSRPRQRILSSSHITVTSVPGSRNRGSVVTAKRWSSTSATGSKIWTFEEIQALTSDKSGGSDEKKQQQPILIDVREPGELASTGRIPGAVNVPITTSPDALHLSPDDFEDRFGFAPPSKQDDELVFYCKAGVRSRAAAGLAREAGFTKVGEYPGSWLEWSAKGGEVER